MKDISNHQNKFEYIWGHHIADKGYATIPNCYFFCKDELSLSDQDALVLGYLIARQFGARKPYISVATISKELGKSVAARRGSLRSLENAGFIKRIFRKHESNEYDLSPGIQRLLNHKCNNPVSKQSYGYRKIARSMYAKTDTKEAKLISNSKKPNTNQIGSIIESRSPPRYLNP